MSRFRLWRYSAIVWRSLAPWSCIHLTRLIRRHDNHTAVMFCHSLTYCCSHKEQDHMWPKYKKIYKKSSIHQISKPLSSSSSSSSSILTLVWSSNRRVLFPAAKSQSRRVLSHDPERAKLPSDESTTSETKWEWPYRRLIGTPKLLSLRVNFHTIRVRSKQALN